MLIGLGGAEECQDLIAADLIGGAEEWQDLIA